MSKKRYNVVGLVREENRNYSQSADFTNRKKAVKFAQGYVYANVHDRKSNRIVFEKPLLR